MSAWIWVIALALLASCKDNAEDGPAPSCDVAAEHLIAVCDPLTGEAFRGLCEIESIPLVTEATRRCVTHTRECTRPALEACDVRSVLIACDEVEDCPAPFKCELDAGECQRCMSDADCAEGRGCFMGNCYDKDSEFYRTFTALFEDGGSP